MTSPFAGRPITPAEAASSSKVDVLPPEVFDAFNYCIIKHLRGDVATFTLAEVANRVARQLRLSGIPTEDLYRNHWLDVEDVYRKAGWKVVFNKLGYNETYHASFTFTRAK